MPLTFPTRTGQLAQLIAQLPQPIVLPRLLIREFLVALGSKFGRFGLEKSCGAGFPPFTDFPCSTPSNFSSMNMLIKNPYRPTSPAYRSVLDGNFICSAYLLTASHVQVYLGTGIWPQISPSCHPFYHPFVTSPCPKLIQPH